MATINYSSCQLDPKLQAELDKEDEASVRNLFELQSSLVQWFKCK
jgi:hypothetical protein